MISKYVLSNYKLASLLHIVVLFNREPCVQISHEPRVENGESQEVVVGDSEHWDVVAEQTVRVEVGPE